jgi:hypothetical protein
MGDSKMGVSTLSKRECGPPDLNQGTAHHACVEKTVEACHTEWTGSRLVETCLLPFGKKLIDRPNGGNRKC